MLWSYLKGRDRVSHRNKTIWKLVAVYVFSSLENRQEDRILQMNNNDYSIQFNLLISLFWRYSKICEDIFKISFVKYYVVGSSTV
jgi:hypothetical protein